jgi:predicted solute-binding protein
LLEKANKQSVAKALHRKANKVEIDQQFSKTQNTENLDKMIELLKSKVSFDDLDKFSEK